MQSQANDASNTLSSRGLGPNARPVQTRSSAASIDVRTPPTKATSARPRRRSRSGSGSKPKRGRSSSPDAAKDSACDAVSVIATQGTAEAQGERVADTTPVASIDEFDTLKTQLADALTAMAKAMPWLVDEAIKRSLSAEEAATRAMFLAAEAFLHTLDTMVRTGVALPQEL
ncbi:hypothetical protein P43SY_011573 [Pythium insidiosum]|uniref:Uncharacterized protein n=1 Tax=Pythium insidiosum TaxID=114742 RepID=A0AAD5LPG1_PYTIN|nr:hypothetical protein P43SY_011573 [Pythium insidiosum]